MSNEEGKKQTVDDILNDVHDEVFPHDANKIEKTKTIVSKLVSTSEDSPSILISEMKRLDSMFKSTLKDVFFAGLFCDGLTDVKKPNEFKLYFVFDLPCMDKLKVSDSKSDVAGILDISSPYLSLWSDTPWTRILPKSSNRDCVVINDFFSYKYTGYIWRTYYYVLMSSRILQWFANLVSAAVANIFAKKNSIFSRWFYNPDELYYDIGIEELGAANLSLTYKSDHQLILEVRSENGLFIDIELSPVLSYNDKYLIPTPQPHNSHLWHIGNGKAEKKILSEGGCTKEVVHYLIKLCRMQGRDWEKLTSYHIKTVVLLHLKNNPWLTKDRALMFMGSLRDLLECLARRRIPHYFNTECNLLSGVDVHIITAMEERLKRILKDIHKNPTITMAKYFTMIECNTETIDGSDPWSCCVM